MAIFIVDQFSLNSDLPIDIRYVPEGGSYNDVSSYWYPGMQVYQTSDETIWYADNSLNWHPISEGTDASLNALYQLVTDLSTYVYNQVAQLNASIGRIDSSMNYIYPIVLTHEASIGDIYQRLQILDSSMNYIYPMVIIHEASIGDIYQRLQILDSSVTSLDNRIDLIEASIGTFDGSINALFGRVITLDTSVSTLTSIVNIHESSLGIIISQQLSQDASISELRSKDASIDVSLNLLGQWNASQDASIEELRQDIADLDSSLDLFVLKAGDTMTGPLTITAGGLVVNPGDVSIFGDLYVQQNAAFGGDLTINGSLYVINTGTLDVSTGFIRLNTGLTGAPPATLQSGIVVERGDQEPYVILYDESLQTFRIGIAQETSTGYLDSSTQAVATRQDTPIINGIAVWNNTAERFDTYNALTFDGQLLTIDGSIHLTDYAGASNLMLVVAPDGTVKSVPTADLSINNLYAYADGSFGARDISISYLNLQIQQLDASVIRIDGSLNVLFDDVVTIDASIIRIDGSINELFARKDTSVLGAINIGDASGHIYAGITDDGSLQFKGIVGSGAAIITESSTLITVSLDASFAGEVNTASNLGSGEGLFAQKVAQDLQFKSIKAVDPSNVIITSDASHVYIDVSLAAVTSLAELTDVSLSAPLTTHQIVEYDASLSVWKNTNNLFWDISLGTTTDDLGGIPAGTDLNGLTLKQILSKILYEYQVPTLLIGSSPVAGIYEKGIVATQFASIDVSWYSTNANYPLALLNNVHITKTGVGSIFDASLGLVATSASSYTDATGIPNWGGTNRTITYNVSIDDDQADQSQPAIGLSNSFTFYYRQYWGEVDGNTNIGGVNSAMILALDSSRLAGESDLTATFTYTSGGKIKYLFAYPDTVATPDNFGTLTQILDQNEFDITGSWDTANEDVSVGLGNVRYRVYLLKNKVDTSTFDVTFKF